MSQYRRVTPGTRQHPDKLPPAHSSQQNRHNGIHPEQLKQLIVPDKEMTSYNTNDNDRPVHILPLVNYKVYWPIIGH